MDIINDFLKRTLKTHTFSDGYVRQDLRPCIKCKDGFTISVQASKCHYCSPCVDGDVKYDEVELGYPSMEDSLINEYAEDPDEPTETVYGYVPISIVDKLIKKHGGIIN